MYYSYMKKEKVARKKKAPVRGKGKGSSHAPQANAVPRKGGG